MNKQQEIVLEWWKSLAVFPISAVYLIEAGRNVPKEVKNAYEDFDKKEEAELLKVYADWVLEEEE